MKGILFPSRIPFPSQKPIAESMNFKRSLSEHTQPLFEYFNFKNPYSANESEKLALLTYV